MRRVLLALAVAALAVTPGCLDLVPARVPDRLLEGAGGNGWTRNATASQREPTSSQGGLVKTQTLVYDDRDDSKGYPGTLSVTTLRALLRPNEEKLRSLVADRITSEARAKGIGIEAGHEEGTRRLADRATAFWFVYNGSVESSGFFAQSAQVKVFGEVFQCPTARTEVVTVGLAQTTDVKSIGGVPLPSDPDFTTWTEIVADPFGNVEGYRSSDGLAYNVAC